VSAGGGSDAGSEEVDLEEGDEMSGGVSTAADALQEKHILAANVLYILLLPLRLILRMLLS